MRANKAVIYAIKLALVTLFLCGGQSAVAQVTGPDVVSGDTYTITYTRKGTTTYLQERVGPNGAWVNITSVNGGSGGVSYTFYAKPAAEYFYRTNVKTVGYRGIVTWWTSAEKRMVVTGPLPANRETIANQMRYTYRASIGDINFDGLLDLFIRRTAGGSSGNGSLQDVILRNVAGGTFVPDVPTAAQVTTASSWPVSPIELRKIDMNFDGFLDLSIAELGTYIPGALGQIVVAPGGSGPAVQRLIPMDAKYTKFMTQTKGWMQNPNYFEDNSQLMLIPVWGYVYMCDYVWRGDYYEYYCGWYWTVIGYSLEYDLSWVDPDSNRLRYSFRTDSNDVLQPVIEPGTPEGQNVDVIFTSVFGVQAFRGNYRSYCIDWDYDTDTYHPPCIDWALALLLVLRDLMPEEDTWRYLTLGEKAEALANGMQIVDVDQVRVYYGARWNMSWLQGRAEAYRGNIYIGNEPWAVVPWSSDYSIDIGPNWLNLSVMVHELAHVYQFRTRGCGYFCKMRVGPRLMPSASDYVYMPWDENKSYWDYNLEAQAQMVQDRFQLRKTGHVFEEGNVGVTTPMLDRKIPF